MAINPTQTIDLQHRAYHLSHGGGVLATSSTDEQISIIDGNANVRQLVSGWDKIHSLSVHPDRELLAISRQINLHERVSLTAQIPSAARS